MDYSIIWQGVLGWFIYWLIGMIKAVVEGDDFSGRKTVYSLLVTILVIILALATGLSPALIWESHGNVIADALNTLVDSGIFVSLIYFFTKLFAILDAAWERFKKIYPPA